MDEEWIQLMVEARNMGLTINDVRELLRNEFAEEMNGWTNESKSEPRYI